MMVYRSSKSVSSTAADWFVRLQDGEPSSEVREQFVAWLQESPAHVAEYLAIASTWIDVGQVTDGLELPQGISAGSNVVSLDVAEERTRFRHDEGASAEETEQAVIEPRHGLSRWVLGAAGAIVVAVGMSAWLALKYSAPVEFQTAIGEQRSLPLEDGSLVSLNTQSQVRLDWTEEFRRIELIRGEALFDVSYDPDRPFIVVAGENEVQALGTSFNVYRQADDAVAVTVLEGRVSVTSTADLQPAGDAQGADVENATETRRIELEPGQQAYLSDASVEILRESADVERATAWIQRRLVFDNDTLSEVVSEFNRYNAVKLEVVDPELADLRLSGVFQAHDPASMVEFLQHSRDIRVTEINESRRLLGP